MVLRVLSAGATTVREISTHTQLTQRQVTYALNCLIAAGVVVRRGGQGSRSTTYELTGRKQLPGQVAGTASG